MLMVTLGSELEIENKFDFISTVKNHGSNLIAKLVLRDRTQAAVFSFRHQI